MDIVTFEYLSFIILCWLLSAVILNCLMSIGKLKEEKLIWGQNSRAQSILAANSPWLEFETARSSPAVRKQREMSAGGQVSSLPCGWGLEPLECAAHVQLGLTSLPSLSWIIPHIPHKVLSLRRHHCPWEGESYNYNYFHFLSVL